VPARVIAVDLKLGIEYLPRYVEIHEGNRFARVYERNAEGSIRVLPATAAATPSGGGAVPRGAAPPR
jgi:hypothetical protein